MFLIFLLNGGKKKYMKLNLGKSVVNMFLRNDLIFNIKHLEVLFFSLLFFSFQIVKEDTKFIYKGVPHKYMNRVQYLGENNLIKKEILNASYSIIQSLPLNYDKTGNTDYTDFIQSALDKYRIVIFPNFPLLINPKGLTLRSNSKVIFKKGSKLILQANKNQNYQILRLHEVQNVELYFPNIIGDREKHFGETGEWGFGISIRGAQNIKIYKAVIKNCWGDGIYVGSLGALVNKDITIKDCFIDNNRRNGISIISGINVNIVNSLISNTNGTAPMSGIDIEPNNNSEFLKNINIISTITFNNRNDGLLIVLRALQGQNIKNINIDIKKHIDDGSNDAIRFVLPNRRNSNDFKKIEGSINIVNSVWKNNKVDLVRFDDYVDNMLNISFINPRVINNDVNFSQKKIFELKSKCRKDEKCFFTE